MIKKWLHIAEGGSLESSWLLRIRSSITEEVEKGNFSVEKEDLEKFSKELEELSLYIHTRINMLRWIHGRVYSKCNRLYEKIKEHRQEHVFTPQNLEATAFRLDYNALKYKLLIDIDSLLFETKSCVELLRDYLIRIYRFKGKELGEKAAYQKFEEIAEEAGQDSTWLKDLKNLRDFFMHGAAPYMAVDVTDPSNPDLLVMKENLKTFDDEKKFKRSSSLDGIFRSFSEFVGPLESHIKSLISR